MTAPTTDHTPTRAHWHRRGRIDGAALAEAWGDWCAEVPRPAEVPAHWIARYVDPAVRLEAGYLDGLAEGWRR